jgi:hypothetical protein
LGLVRASEKEGADVAAARPARDAVERPAAAMLSRERLLGLQRSAGNRAVQRILQRRETILPTGPRDWRPYDRENATKTWWYACLTNLDNVDAGQYRRVVERRDFYKWFYLYTANQGYTTRWPLAAAIVANGAHLIADMDEDHAWANSAFEMAQVELQGIMREGNEVIFKDVLPKLKKLKDGGPLTGRAALEWDMQALAEEQTLIQPMYRRMSQATRDQLEYIARKKWLVTVGSKVHWPWNDSDDYVTPGMYQQGGKVPSFDRPDMQSITDRWTYGMMLGATFAPTPTGFDPAKDKMPTVSADYTSGAAFARLDTRPALHELDAWLNPNRLDRVGAGSDYKAIIARLTDGEKREVLADLPPDGGSYAINFAQFSFITEADVRAALPTGSSSTAAVNAFVKKFIDEQARVEAHYADQSLGGGF